MRLGILKTDDVRPEWVDEFGEYPDMFMRLLREADPQLEFSVYDVQNGDYPRDIDDVDAYLLTGSKASVYDDEAWIHNLMAFVRELHAQKKPLVGICFGHQLVAQALGGLVEKSSKGWGAGLHTHTFTKMPAWHDGDVADLDILVSHQDQVTRAAQGSEVLAGSEFCENAVCQLGDHILTFQGHPEFLSSYARVVMDSRVERMGEAVHRRAVDSLAGESQSLRVAAWITHFLKTPEPAS